MSMSHKPNTLGIDFGTSNSAAGITVNGAPHLVDIEPGNKTLPTSVFFDAASRKMQFGTVANDALIQGREGRYMRSLKSVLGTSLMQEKRNIMGESLSFFDIIGRFLAEVKSRAEAACFQTFDHALSGRPVRFHSMDAAKDAQALTDLTECYRLAGFKEVRFMYEPEAAALAVGALDGANATGLIVDIGGGTSDFSVFRCEPGADRPTIRILASHGVRVGGTHFDKSISVDHVMPLLGKGSDIRNELGAGRHVAPNGLFQDLATWEKIPFLYAPDTRRTVAKLRQMAAQPERFARLSTVLEFELGHELAFAVERGKIQVNSADRDSARIDMRMIEKHLSAEVGKAELAQSLVQLVEKISDCALETVAMAGCAPAQIDKVIFVGGSSLIVAVQQAMATAFPNAAPAYSEAFTAVVDGLALASAQSGRTSTSTH